MTFLTPPSLLFSLRETKEPEQLSLEPYSSSFLFDFATPLAGGGCWWRAGMTLRPLEYGKLKLTGLGHRCPPP